MRPLKSVLPGLSPGIVVKEAAWRISKKWKRFRLSDQLRQKSPFRFRPVGYYRCDLVRPLESAQSIWTTYADAICEGTFSVLGYGPVFLGFPPPWGVDFVSGKDWPLKPSGEILVVRHDKSDVKVPWELSRLQFLPVLGKAWRLTGDERYRRATMQLLTDWIENQPVGVGVNWTVAMEAALRSMSICFTLELLWPIGSDDRSWLESVNESLWQHLLFIESHLEFSYVVRSNHYLSNIVGLFCLSAYFQGNRIGDRRARYTRLLEQEILHQVYEDGGDFEASTGYHVLVTQMFLIAYRIMLASGIAPSASFVQRLRAMFHWMTLLADKEGRLPNVGDCDDGRVELLYDDLDRFYRPSGRDSLLVPSFLGLVAAVLHEPCQWESKDLMWFEDVRPKASGAPERSNHDFRARVLANSGIGIARRNGTAAFLFAVPNGIKGMGSHAHNDKLSVIVHLFGSVFLCDSGTFTYTRDAATRNQFRSTAAHNTILVDAQEQNRIDGRPIALFSLLNDAKVSPIALSKSEESLQLSASHSGYQRLGVLHTRKLEVKRAGFVQIEDTFAGQGSHSFQAQFHLGPDWKIREVRPRANEILCRIEGPRTVEMSITAAVALRGWSEPARQSTAYGTDFPGTRICVFAESLTPFALQTRIYWEE
jgi:Heparinase II/III-like protein/Heparinase II/III N-terminus